jgi:hypothetical protein
MGGVMSSIVVSGDTSGAVTLAVPAVAGTNTVTIAAQTGTLNAAGPAFSAYQSSTQSLAAGSGSRTKIQLQTEEFDTNNNFDSSTNYRFTPTVAGYYQINGCITAAASTELVTVIYKNGSIYKAGSDVATSTPYASVVSSIIYCNGSTDYLELYAFSGNSTTSVSGISATWFNGCLVRGA